MSKTYVIAFYELDRVYGGSEEGGWWYNTGNLVRIFRVVKNEEYADRLARRAQRLLDHCAKRGGYRSDLYSMGYSGGAYAAYVYEDKAPPYWPEQTPHYE
jgi:hypothetical protein